MLVARLHYDDRPSVQPVEVGAELPYPVTSLLPPEVAVGFSAATGANMELHQILAWSFNSTLAPHKKPISTGMCLSPYLQDLFFLGLSTETKHRSGDKITIQSIDLAKKSSHISAKDAISRLQELWHRGEPGGGGADLHLVFLR
jgi:hypothetical protein